MEPLSKGWKITLTIIGITVFIGALLIWGKPYKPEPRTPAYTKTAEQVEQEDLVKKIQSGSYLWADKTETIEALQRELQVEIDARAKVERYTAGYRDVLCEKFGYVLTASGSLQRAANCGRYDTEVQADFQ